LHPFFFSSHFLDGFTIQPDEADAMNKAPDFGLCRGAIAFASRHDIIPYFIASLAALLIDLGIFSLAIRIVGISWFWAATLGFVAGALTAYLLSIWWVFSKRRMKGRPYHEFALFVIIGVAGLGVTQIVLWIGIERIGALPELVKLAAAGVTFVFNYGLRKVVLFVEPGEARP